jgi:hypothetical protein
MRRTNENAPDVVAAAAEPPPGRCRGRAKIGAPLSSTSGCTTRNVSVINGAQEPRGYAA